MFAAFGRSFRLIGESYRVLRHDPELIWLTLFSFAGVVFLVVVLGAFGFGTGQIDTEGQLGSGGIVLLALGYFIGYFIIIYFQVALVASVMYRMSGGDPNVRYGLSQANHHLGAILTWTLIAATVGLILKMLESAARGERGGIIAQIIISVLGFAWGLMVFFVIPVIVIEGVSGVSAIKRSTSVLKQRWGEAVIGTQGISFIVMLATLVVAGVPIALGVVAVNGGVGVVGIPLVALGGGIAVFMMAGGSALDSTYRAVLYNYATTGETGGVSKELLDSTFRPKQDLRHGGF
jgi:hypothetical protein